MGCAMGRPMEPPMGTPTIGFPPWSGRDWWGPLGSPGHTLGTIWGALGHTLGTLWVPWASLATPRTPLGHPLGSLGHPWGTPWAPFGLAWALLGRLLGTPGHPFSTLGTHLGGHFCHLGSVSPKKSQFTILLGHFSETFYEHATSEKTFGMFSLNIDVPMRGSIDLLITIVVNNGSDA